MTTTTPSVYNYSIAQWKTYFFALIFIIGNLIFPQLAHLVPMGGLIFLPIYFFTLIGAYKYGIWVGLLTAILSPLANSLFFGMPPVPSLPAILLKSVMLAVAAAYMAKKFGRVHFLAVLLAVIAYQIVGMSFEWIYKGSLSAALQDIRIGYPGLAFQIFGGYLVLLALKKL
ncbi:MAG: ECF transporter S component [Bacteroidales bacterium]|jgi:hypothetical protein|nr:ECF transporter S component [Bacteroidales bacterium]